ncbi:hypothetical protein [Rhizobium sp. TH2]|uniref:hypothetical protein n=1 Tax=Rhizobium sp. TH2 TaxID=2775403 RepID=UPI0021582A35|nr:hypothetical protein [Rhizobium sp. TH2]
MTTASDTDESLISNRLLFRLTAAIGVLAALTALISVAGKNYGDELSLGGHTASTEIQHVIVGHDVIALPANVIRFESQRRSGPADAVSVYLSWPPMEGYSHTNALAFSNPANTEALVFADFSQSVMSRDMSGRLEPIYERLFTGKPRSGPSGLAIHDLSEKSGFGDEKLLTGTTKTGAVYAVRCILPRSRAHATAADCQRDIHVGRDLTLLYRFSSNLLPQWEKIDIAMLEFATRHIKR